MEGERRRVTQPEGGRLMVKQAMAEEVNINTIMARYRATGVPPRSAQGFLTYGDFSSSMSFHEALGRVREAELAFDALPSHVRKYCENDPGRFLELVYDPDRKDELVALGLVEGQMPEKARPEAKEEAVKASPEAKAEGATVGST